MAEFPEHEKKAAWIIQLQQQLIQERAYQELKRIFSSEIAFNKIKNFTNRFHLRYDMTLCLIQAGFDVDNKNHIKLLRNGIPFEEIMRYI